MNLTHCKHCGAELQIGPNATNKKFCSSVCYTAWWTKQTFTSTTQESKVEKWAGEKVRLTLTEAQAAWLACAVDGEGTIGIWRQRSPQHKSGWKYRPVVQVCNTHYGFIAAAKTLTGGYMSIDNNPTVVNKKHKPCYRANANRRAVARILEQIAPHLIIKRKQADLVLEYCRAMAASPVHNRAMQPMFERLYYECKALNKRGTK